MTFVDTNVLLDIVTNDPAWFDWSARQLRIAVSKGALLINDVIYAELSVRFATLEALEAEVERLRLVRRATPSAALFLAGKAFERYRRSGGARQTLLPDFFISADAALHGAPLITRDPRYYRSYFSSLDLICP